MTARSWCQGARGEPGAEPRGAAAGAQCERHPSRPHPRVRAVAVPVPDAVRPEALDLRARGVPGAREPGLGFLAAVLRTALGRARHQNTLEGLTKRMLMFDPVPVKQEAMDPVSVSYPSNYIESMKPNKYGVIYSTPLPDKFFQTPEGLAHGIQMEPVDLTVNKRGSRLLLLVLLPL